MAQSGATTTPVTRTTCIRSDAYQIGTALFGVIPEHRPTTEASRSIEAGGASLSARTQRQLRAYSDRAADDDDEERDEREREPDMGQRPRKRARDIAPELGERPNARGRLPVDAERVT
jgi:hypothetical protein